MGMPMSEMDANNDSDWRSSLSPECRLKIEKRIMNTLQGHMPSMGQECLTELWKISRRFEEKIFVSATDQQDYVQKIAFKLLTLERRSEATNDIKQGELINPHFGNEH